LGAAAALVLGWVTLTGVHHLEEDNNFCHSCHIGGKPLHTDQYLAVTQGRGDSLAAGHSVSIRDGGKSRHMRCVDCHTGITPGESVRFHWVAFADLVEYVAGQGEEPKNLSQPMPDHNCTRCHASIRHGEFHLIRAHQGDMQTNCTDCHRVHHPGGGPARTNPEHNKTVCVHCHKGMADKVLELAGALPPEPLAKTPVDAPPASLP